jgi:enoyl-CoA hydratase/carnithine racemase
MSDAFQSDYLDGELHVEMQGHVGVAEIRRPPNNFFDIKLIQAIADAFEALDKDTNCRAIVLAAQGKAFCAGAMLGDSSGASQNDRRTGTLYEEAVRLFAISKPIIGAIQGAAVGGGLGLAVMPDFRVACPESRFCANFTRLGFHPGFGLTVTLPELIGRTKAELMFATSRRIKGDEAYAIGLADVLVPQDQVRQAAIDLGKEIAENSPLGVVATRNTVRLGLVERVKAATDRELAIQDELRSTTDFNEGVKAMSERRTPNFQGK